MWETVWISCFSVFFHPIAFPFTDRSLPEAVIGWWLWKSDFPVSSFFCIYELAFLCEEDFPVLSFLFLKAVLVWTHFYSLHCNFAPKLFTLTLSLALASFWHVPIGFWALGPVGCSTPTAFPCPSPTLHVSDQPPRLALSSLNMI